MSKDLERNDKLQSTTTMKESLYSNYLFRQVVSSSAGGMAVALLVTPLDVIKIRLQAQNRIKHEVDCFIYRNGVTDHVCKCSKKPENWYNRKIPGGRYHGTIDALIKIVRVDGIRSLWSGLQPTLLMAIPQIVLYFTAYEEAKRIFGYDSIENPNVILPMVSGGVARVIAVTAVSPIELIRTKLQSEKLKYSELARAVRYSIKNEGYLSLYRGWVSTVWRDVPFSMIYWFSYETLKMYSLRVLERKELDSSVSIYYSFNFVSFCFR
jgi:solute carrier family 25, member 39/40